MMKMADMVQFVGRRVDAQLGVWGIPGRNHIDYEADEFQQQASVDLWLATQKRHLAERGMVAVIRRSMAQLLRKRLGKNGCKSMVRMSTEALDKFEAPATEYPFILHDTFDYISRKLGGTGIILDCFKRGASITDIIDALQMSVSSFYLRLNRIRAVLEN